MCSLLKATLQDWHKHDMALLQNTVWVPGVQSVYMQVYQLRQDTNCKRLRPLLVTFVTKTKSLLSSLKAHMCSETRHDRACTEPVSGNLQVQ